MFCGEIMGNVTIYLHQKTQAYADFISTALDTSRSEVVEDMIKYVRDEGLEKEVWGKEGLEAIEDAEEKEESESEESEEVEAEEEEKSE